jgi:glycosyltransferase involved in cell wall biosynthesis
VFFWNRTLREWLHLNGALEMHLLHKKNAKHEREIARRVKYVNGVNTWDISMFKEMNPKLKTFRIEYNLREESYRSPKWNVENMERHTIFTNPGGTPLKGLHQLLKAVALLKDKYPDILVKVPGMGKNGELIVRDAYSKYIKKQIKKLGLQGHVQFFGRQTGEEMCQKMLSANVVVVPSATESTSMIVREGMYLGCPCITSFRGGMADFIADKQDGFLYDYPEYAYLATRIDELFSSDTLCETFSKNAIEKATVAHDRQKNVQAYLDMYREINEDEN